MLIIHTQGLPNQEGEGEYTFTFTGRKHYQLQIPHMELGRSGECQAIHSKQEKWVNQFAKPFDSKRLLDAIWGAHWRCRSAKARDEFIATLRSKEPKIGDQ